MRGRVFEPGRQLLLLRKGERLKKSSPHGAVARVPCSHPGILKSVANSHQFNAPPLGLVAILEQALVFAICSQPSPSATTQICYAPPQQRGAPVNPGAWDRINSIFW